MKQTLRAVVTAGVAITLALGVTACTSTPSSTPGPDAPSAITIGIPSSQFDTAFNPADGGYGVWMLPKRPAYDTLMIWDLDTKDYAPWLASEFELSEDGTTLSLTLREDVDFIDGEHMDAEAVVKALNAAFTGEGSYFNNARFDGAIANVTGEYTLDITTSKPIYFDTSQLMIELTYLPIASPAAVEDPTLFEDGPVGTGPYLLKELVPDVSITYERNPDYWNSEAFEFDEVTIAVYDDKVSALNALKTGQLNAAEVDFSLAAEAEASGLTLNTGPGGYTMLVVLDRKGEMVPALGDVRVRQAMNMAFDREAIAETLELGFGHASSQPFLEGSNEYVEGGDDRYPYDPERARELIAEAGYPDGFTVRIPGGPYQPWGAIDYRPIIEESLGAIGITVEWVKTLDLPEQDAAVKNFDVDLGFVHTIFQNTIRGFSQPHVPWAMQPIDDPQFLEWIEKYSNGTPAEHAESQPLLAEYILEQAWYIPFSQPQQIWATGPGIEAELTNLPSFFPTLLTFRAAS